MRAAECQAPDGEKHHDDDAAGDADEGGEAPEGGGARDERKPAERDSVEEEREAGETSDAHAAREPAGGELHDEARERGGDEKRMVSFLVEAALSEDGLLKQAEAGGNEA